MSSVKYELKYKIKGHGWKVFDTYKTPDDPKINEFATGIKAMKYSEGVKLIKVETIRIEVDIIESH